MSSTPAPDSGTQLTTVVGSINMLQQAIPNGQLQQTAPGIFNQQIGQGTLNQQVGKGGRLDTIAAGACTGVKNLGDCPDGFYNAPGAQMASAGIGESHEQSVLGR